jgi:hypothetical protein
MHEAVGSIPVPQKIKNKTNFEKKKVKKKKSQVLVAHACNPSYSGSRDQEDRGLKPAQANSSARPCLKKPFTKIGLVKWFKVKALSSQKKKER